MITSNIPNTPTLKETIQVMIDSNLVDLRVCLPAKVVSYDASTQYAEVQIQLLQSYEDTTVMPWPVILDVPVVFPRANGGKAYIHFPLQEGDDLTLVFCERSLDNWKSQGGMTDPKDRRKFDASDAFALVGGSAKPNAFTVKDPTAIEISNTSETVLQILPNGKYSINGGNADELISFLNDFVTSISRAFTATSLGPEKLIDPMDPGFTQLITRIMAFKG